MAQIQNTIPSKITGDSLTAVEFTELKDQANSNATDAESRLGTNSTNITTNTTNIGTNDTDIQANTDLINLRISAEQSTFACGTIAYEHTDVVGKSTSLDFYTVNMPELEYGKLDVQVLGIRSDLNDLNTINELSGVVNSGGVCLFTTVSTAETKMLSSDLAISYHDDGTGNAFNIRITNSNVTYDYTITLLTKVLQYSV